MTGPHYRLSISTGSLYHWRLDSIFRLGRELGVDGLELVLGPEALLAGPRCLVQLQAAHGLPVLSLHPPVLPLPGWLRFSAVVQGLAYWATALSIPVVTLHTPEVADIASPRGQRFVAGAQDLAARLSACGSRLSLENRARFDPTGGPMCVDRPEQLRDLACRFADAVTFDTAHAGTLYGDFMGAYETLAPQIVNVHLSDLRGPIGGIGARWTDTLLSHHQVPGAGRLPLHDLLGRLRARGYGGLITLECSPVALRSWSGRQTRRLLAESVDLVRSRMA